MDKRPAAPGDAAGNPPELSAGSAVRLGSATGTKPLLPAEMTLSELIDALRAVATDSKSTVEARTARYESLLAMRNAYPIIGTPFQGAFDDAADAAAETLGVEGPDRDNAAESFFSSVGEFFSGPSTEPLPGEMPLPKTRIPFDASDKRPFGKNGQLAVSLSTMTYELARFNYDNSTWFGPAFEKLYAQGFTDAKLHEGYDHGDTDSSHDDLPGGARLYTGTRSDVSAIAFRGTDFGADPVTGSPNSDDLWKADRKALLVDGSKEFGAGKVHRGFRAWLDSVWPQLKAHIMKSLRENPDRPLLFTGHSLGAALAVLAVARAKQEGLLEVNPVTGKKPQVVLETFAQPRVGDQAFANHFAEVLGDITYHRYVYREDPVTALPLTSLGYAEIPSAELVYIEADGSASVSSASKLDFMRQDFRLGMATQTAVTAKKHMQNHAILNYQVIGNRLAR